MWLADTGTSGILRVSSPKTSSKVETERTISVHRIQCNPGQIIDIKDAIFGRTAAGKLDFVARGAVRAHSCGDDSVTVQFKMIAYLANNFF